MKNTSFLLAFILSASLFSTQLFAQAPTNLCPPNLDFEFGNIMNWQCSIGSVATGPIYSLFNQGGPTFFRQDVTPTNYNGVSGTDFYGNFPVKCPAPNGGNYSVRLGNENAGSECERIKYQVHVPANSVNYNITFNYAVVLEDPAGHFFNEKPRFEVNVYDSATNQIIPCATFSFTAGANMAGFSISPNSIAGSTVYYKPWSAHYMSFHKMQGHTLSLEFTTSDCTLGGHFGYAYIDFSSQCDSTKLVGGYCLGIDTGSLIAPPGFQSYAWYDTLYNLLDTGQTIGINHFFPSNYILITNPFAGYGCIDTFYQIVSFMPKPKANFGMPSNYCAGSLVPFTDSSFSLGYGTYIGAWSWDFGDANASVGLPNPNYSNIQNPTHIYNQLGTYTVALQVWNTSGCVSDTIFKTIHINQLPPPLPVIASNDSVCVGDTIVLTFVGTQLPGYTYTWNVNPGTNIIANSTSGTYSITVVMSAAGNAFIGFSATPPPGDTACVAHVDYPIYVNGVSPFFFISGVNSVCPFQNDTLHILNAPSSCGSSSNACTGTIPYDLGLITSASMSAIPSPFQGAATEGRCQLLFSQSEIIAAGFLNGGVISDIAWEVLSKNSAIPYYNLSIKMACVPYSSFVAGQMDKTTPLTTVYASAFYNTVNGNNNFTLTTPYNWDGVSNLLIDVCYDNGTFNASGDDRVKKSIIPAGQNWCNWASSNNDGLAGCDPNYPLSALVVSATERPDIIFKGCYGNTTPNLNFIWTSSPAGFSGNGSTVVVAPGTATTYTASASINGCAKSQSFIVNTNSAIIVNAGADQSLCSGGVANLAASTNATGVLSYSWTSIPASTIANANNPTISVNPTVTTTYILVVSSPGNACTASDQVVVAVGTNFYIQHNADTTVCTGALLNLWASAPNVSATGFSWSSNSLNTISCNNCAPAILTANASDVLSITATSSFGCVSTDSFHVLVKPFPNAAFTMPTAVCEGSLITISFIGNGSAMASYNWNFAGAVVSPSTMNQGPYTASWYTAGVKTVTLLVNDNGCLANSSNTLVVLPQPIAHIALQQNELCANTPLTITTVGSIFSNPSTFNFSFGSATPSSATNTTGDSMTITFSNTGIAYTNYITLQIVSNGCISAIDSVAVTVYPLPTADAGSDQYIFPGNTTALDGSASTGGNTYNWSPSTLVSNSTTVTPTTSPAASTTYVLLYSNLPAGCVDRDTVIINVLDCRTAQFPNSFSPNGDGKNDYFMILNPADIEQIERFEIFNRWGQLVFATNDKNSKGWDGTFNGVQQPVNTYIYNLQATCGKGNKVVAHGDVSLFR